jgi:murein DD-endopeptidase MepM/ murein hydrolase activator NlpD
MLLRVFLLIPLLLLPPPPEALWTWPTEGSASIVRDFRAPSTPWGPGHRGLDLAAKGPNIVAPIGGVVSFSGLVAGRGVVTIRTTEGVLISMEPVAALVTEGDHVSQGQRIATLEPGHCAEPCLHLGLREGGEYRSPRRELGVLQRSVLLPLGDYARG